MDLPRRYRYDPKWRLALLILGIGVLLVILVAARGRVGTRSLRLAAVLASPFVVLALVVVSRRLVFRRFIELEPDALLLPTGFLHLRTRRIELAEIRDVVDDPPGSGAVLWIKTEKGDFPVWSVWLPEVGSYSRVRDFLLPYRQEETAKLQEASREERSRGGWRRRLAGCLVETTAFFTWAGLLYGSLFFAAAGNGAVLAGLFPQRSPGGAALVTLLGVPCLIVLVLTYFNRSPFSQRTHCIWLLVAVGWYAVQTVGTELLIQCDLIPSDSAQDGRTIGHVLMHLGWLSLIPITLLYRSARAAMLESAA